MLKLFSRDLANFILHYLVWNSKKQSTARLRHAPNTYSSDFLRGFVRGLIDTNGYVNPVTRRVILTSASVEMIQQCKDILAKRGISSRARFDKIRGNRKVIARLEITGDDPARLLRIVLHNPVRIPKRIS